MSNFPWRVRLISSQSTCSESPVFTLLKMAFDPYRSMDFSLTIPERLDAYFRSLVTPTEYDGFETHPLQQVEYVSHSEDLQQIVYSMNVPASLCNKDGNLHGGAASTVLDNLSSTALFTVARPGFWDNMGVSRSLHVIFYRPVPAGSRVEVICSVIATGKRMASVKAEIRTENGNKLCVTCSHDKVAPQNQVKL